MSSFTTGLIEHFTSENDVVVVPIERTYPLEPLVAEFRIVKDLYEIKTLKQRCGEWIAEQNTLAQRGIQQGKLKEFWVDDPDILWAVFALAEQAIDPDQQNRGDWLELARKNGGAFEAVWSSVSGSAIKNRELLIQTKVLQEKKGSKTTSTAPE
jgi:hypothetical protein